MDSTAHFYSAPTAIPYFEGRRRQTGGGIFGSLARVLLPKLKDFGKTAARRAISAAANVANDVAEGSNIGDALKSRGKEFLKQSLTDGMNQFVGRKRSKSPVPSGSPPKRLRRKAMKQRSRRGRGKPLF